MRPLGLFVAFFLLTAGILTGGCGSGGGGGPVNNQVSGTVRDSDKNDALVGGASVAIGGKTTTTAADGTFSLQGVSLGSDTATVTVTGQAGQKIGFYPPAGAGATQGLVLTLNIGQIRGKVTLANQPVAGARVTDVETGFDVLTNQDGTFLLESIPAGATSVVAVAPTAAKTVTVTVVNGVNDVGTIALEADTNTTPPGPPSGTLIGRITLADQTSAAAGAGTTVFLLQNGVQVDQVLTNATAEFGFYALPGTGYSLLVRKNAYKDKQSDVFAITDPATPVRKDLTLDLN